MKKNKREKIEFSIQIPKKLNDAIQKDADRNKRSRNLQINLILERNYENEISDGGSPARETIRQTVQA